MVEQKIIVLGLAVVLALGTLGFNWVETNVPSASTTASPNTIIFCSTILYPYY